MFGDWFNRPWYLLLLVFLLPALWAVSWKTLSGLGPIRKWFAILFRTIVITLIVLALAEMQYLRKSDRMTVIYLLDQSASIPRHRRDDMLEYAKEDVRANRNARRGDRAALIVFGRQASIEVPPVEAELPILGQLETIFELREDATNLAAAMKLAQATFPEDSSRRIVIVTDGNENVGDAHAMARLLASDGIGIDVVPIELGDHPEVAIERVTLPSDIRKGAPFSAKVVVNNITPPGAEEKNVKGTIKLTRRMGQTVETLSEQTVELNPGKNVYSFENEINLPDWYEYEAAFVPDDARSDLMTENNRATAYTHVMGQGHVLFIEDWEAGADAQSQKNEFDFLINRLRSENIQVTRMLSNQLFSSLAELQRYDAVVLANVPRSSGDEKNVTNFSDDQIRMLVSNTEDTGCGLIMIGGPKSFGAGGWTNSDLEKALPVDFQIDNAKVAPVGALAMVMHAGEMAQGNYWQKEIGAEALKALGPQDYCGVVHWVGSEEWLWGLPNGLVRVGPNKRKMVAALSRMTPGDMPDFDPSLRMAAASFKKLKDASIKHMIVISDGDPSPASTQVLDEFKKLGAKITAVAVGSHGRVGHAEMERIADYTGGKYYVVRDPRALPKIYQREARRVARPLVKEKTVQPIVTGRHEILKGINSAPPAIDGFVLTTVKDNPLVEVMMISPDPVDQKNATLMAAWTYGLGRSAVLTTDAGSRWANRWTTWENYDKLFSQLVRWSMRPTGDQGSYNVATQTKDGKVKVVITAIDKDDELQNFLDMSASVVGPDMKSSSFNVHQVAPGRYVGEFDSEKSGSYFLAITPEPGKPPVRTGINVPYSAEYRDREMNSALIEQIAAMNPQGGEPGQVVAGNSTTNDEGLLARFNPFRLDLAPAMSSREIWPLLVLASSCVFFADVFIRRVAVGFDWVPLLWQKVRRTLFRVEVEPQVDERMARLRSRKMEVEDEIVGRRAATRFEPEPDAHVSENALEMEATDGSDQAKTRPSTEKDKLTPAEVEEDTYTSRLLKAKNKVWKDKKE